MRGGGADILGGEMSKCEGPEAEANLRTGKRARVVGAHP